MFEPVAYSNWVANDNLARAVILTALDESEYEGVDDASTAVSLYDKVKVRVEGEGPVCMVSLIQEVLKIQCSPNESLTIMAKKICDTVHRIFTIKALDEDLFKCVILFNSLSDLQYALIQAQVSQGLADAIKAAPYSSNNIRKLMETMQNLTSPKSSGSGLTADAALAATTQGHWCSQKPWLPGHTYHAGAKCCTTCTMHGRSCGGHEAPYCAHLGRAMEKQEFNAAQTTVQAANLLTSPQPQKGKGSASGGKVYTQLMGPQGKVYLVEDGDLGKLQTLSSAPVPAGFAGLMTDKIPTTLTSIDKCKWEGWMATIEEEDPRVSIDWLQNSGETMASIPSQDQDIVLTTTDDQPFYVDSGATVHISPYKSDFDTLQPIMPKDIKEVGGSAITARDVGNIQLHTKDGCTLLLQNALYVPSLTIRLVSVSCISVDNDAHSFFDSKGVQIVSTSSGKVIIQGPLVTKKKLYTIDLFNAVTEYAYSTC